MASVSCRDFLTRAGFKVAIDGQFGTATLKAVKRFEAAHNRPVDGVMDAGDIDGLRSLAGQPGAGNGATPTTPASQAPALTQGDRAQIGPDGLASAPASAPDPVKAIIAAANMIATKPYRYGGGHGRWNDSGYDCSGSMSYALHGAGLLDAPLTSSGFADYGDTGAGQWVTIYASSGHSYMVVPGLRFDTTGRTKAARAGRPTCAPRTDTPCATPPASDPPPGLRVASRPSPPDPGSRSRPTHAGSASSPEATGHAPSAPWCSPPAILAAMLHQHVSYSHFPQFDRLEQILLNWPKLFEQLPTGTQPLHVEHDTVIVLCQDETWVRFISENSDDLVERLRPMIAGDVRLELAHLQPVLATPTEIFLARQLIVVLSKLRDLEVGF
jgi:hypothetical protein